MKPVKQPKFLITVGADEEKDKVKGRVKGKDTHRNQRWEDGRVGVEGVGGGGGKAGVGIAGSDGT